MKDCLIAFGANLGDPTSAFQDCLEVLRANPNVINLSTSSVHQTQPVGGPAGQSAYLNAAFRFSTDLTPVQLHAELIKIETSFGRTRGKRWGARKIDLDLLLYGADQIRLSATTDSAELTVPHPRMSFRRFVLEPALEIAAEMLHPVSGLTIAELVQHLNTAPTQIVWVTTEPNAAKEICSNIKSESKWNSDWQFLIVTPEQNIAPSTGRLLVFDDRETPAKQNAAQKAGLEVAQKAQQKNTKPSDTMPRMPTLDLSGCDPNRMRTELTAAIEAMQ